MSKKIGEKEEESRKILKKKKKNVNKEECQKR